MLDDQVKQDMISELAKMKANKNQYFGRLLNHSYRYMGQLANSFLKDLGYENFRFGHLILMVNIDLEGSNVITLASTAGISKQAMSKLIKEVESEGMITVEKAKNDARALIVKHTEAGLKFMYDWKQCSQAINKHFESIIGPERMQTTIESLGLIVQQFEKSNPNYDSDFLKYKLNIVENIQKKSQ